MKRLDWTLQDLADFMCASATKDLHPERLPNIWLERLFEAAAVAVAEEGAHSLPGHDAHRCHDKAFDALCGVVLRLRHAEWRHAAGGVYVTLPELWRAIAEYGVALARERAARLYRQSAPTAAYREELVGYQR